MEQPWPQPQESAPDADDLPLAGLLAELLAAAETESAPPPEDDPVAALAQPAGWQGESRQEAALDAPEVLRALDEAAQSPSSSGGEELSGMVMARLAGEGEPEAEPGSSSGSTDEHGLAASGVPGPAETGSASPASGESEVPAADGIRQPELEEPEEEAAGDLSAVLLDRIMGAGACRTIADAAEAAQEELQLPAARQGTGEEPPVPGGDETGATTWCIEQEDAEAPAAGSAGVGHERWKQTGEQAGPAASGAAAPVHVDPPAAEPSVGDAGRTGPAGDSAGHDGTTAAETASFLESGMEEARPAPLEVAGAAEGAEDSAARPAASPLAVSAGDEDEFELVDAGQAEKMLDRLLDAARSAIRSTQAQTPGGALAGSSPAAASSRPLQAGEASQSEPLPLSEKAAARLPAGSDSVEAGLRVSPVPPTPAGEPAVRETPPRTTVEDRAGDVSPIPPAAALMALGLPERLRARLESLGDVEQILRSQKQAEPAQDRKPRLLVFRAGGESYGLSMECVREVERVSRVTPVPGAPEFVRGLVNLRGEILPLLDVAALFSQKGDAPSPRLIVAQAGPGEPPVALMVEELNGLAPFHEGGVEPPPQPGKLRGSLEHRGRRVWWIDPVAVFGAEALEKAAGEGQPGGMEERA